jgi:hypothetical protein
MATVVITVTTSQSAADVKEQMLLNGTSTYTITNSPNAQDRVARWIDGVATGTFDQSGFTVAIS